MFKKIGDKITYPAWATPRYRRLDLYDRLLDGTFYDHLSHSFYDETEGRNRYIPLEERRPSVQYNLSSFVAKKIARKLFAGRHAPRFAHENTDLQRAATALAREGFLEKKLIRAAVWGSVGAVLVTFKLHPDNAGQKRIVFEVWRAKWCDPSFDVLGELQSVRIAYLTYGYQFIQLYGIKKDDDGKDIAPGEEYWHVSELDDQKWVIYQPRPKDSWPPDNKHPLKPMDEKLQPDQHNFGFVPAHWFVNLSSGDEIDGDCLFKNAINTAIDIDYTMSQLGRGVRYNASPQVVLMGQRKNASIDNLGNQSIRGPAHVIEMEGTRRDSAGNQIGGGDAKLLEMSGQGIKVGLDLVADARKMALESIAASRKDPDKIGGPQSGRAMEMLDDDPLDLYDELRTAWGENGILPLTRKAMRAAQQVKHALLSRIDLDELDALALYWPRPYQPGAQELLQMGQGLVALCTPIPEGGKVTPPATGADGKALPAEPILTTPILTVEETRRVALTMLDVPPDVATMPGQQEPVPEGGGSPPPPPPVEPAEADRNAEGGGGNAEAAAARLSRVQPEAPRGRARRKKVTQ